MMRVAVAMLPEVRELLAEDPSQISALLEEIHDEDLADLLGMLEEHEAALILKTLKPEDAAPIFERLDEDQQEALVEELGVEDAAPIVSEMAADERTDLIEALPDKVGDDLFETLEKVDPEAAAEVEELAKWPEDSAGGLMTTDYVSAPPTLSVAETIQLIREQSSDAETIYYVYVLNDKKCLLGIVSLRDLLLASATDKLVDVMTENIFAVSPETDQEEVARKMAKYDFAAWPVVRPDKRLLGVITVDDVMDVLTQEQTEDVQRLAAVEPIEDGYFQTSFWTFIRKRAPWLAALLISEFVTGTVLRHYDQLIEAVSKLAYYVPMLRSDAHFDGRQHGLSVLVAHYSRARRGGREAHGLESRFHARNRARRRAGLDARGYRHDPHLVLGRWRGPDAHRGLDVAWYRRPRVHSRLDAAPLAPTLGSRSRHQLDAVHCHAHRCARHLHVPECRQDPVGRGRGQSDPTWALTAPDPVRRLDKPASTLPMGPFVQKFPTA
jgi:magnesium transporter